MCQHASSQPILHVASLRALEARHTGSVPSLMERAGAAAARIAIEMLTDPVMPILVVAGPGNNGGDACVAARVLRDAGRRITLAFLGNPDRLPAEARAARDAWVATGGAIGTEYPHGEYGLIIDGLFGIGLSRAPEGRAAEWIEHINAARSPVLSLDIPSGLDAETGTVPGIAVTATRTANFIAATPGLFTNDGPDHAGEVVHCKLGLTLEPTDGDGATIAITHFIHSLKPRRHNSHKGSFGSVAIIGGAPGMTGAALLAGRAALRLGAGRVYLGMLDNPAIDAGQPELMLRPPQEAIDLADIIAIGPGLGNSDAAGELLLHCLDSNKPLILDADALNLPGQDALLMRRVAVRPAPTFITPHPGEAARLLDTTTTAVQSNRLACAIKLVERLHAHVVLKGCGSIVISPGGRWFINRTGNPGLATAGSGDVLTGVLAALLAQHWSSPDALLGAVYLHGSAAERCVRSGIGPIGLAAGELIDAARAQLNEWIADHYADRN